MELWLALAVFAQFLFAVSVLIDKHIVVRAAHIGRPIVYAFYVSLLSGAVIVMAPFGLISWPSETVFLFSTASAVAFVAAIFFLYNAFKVARASDVAPVVGAISTCVVLAFAWFLLEDDISAAALPAVALLAGGTALISRFHFKGHALSFAFLSGFCFGTAIFCGKIVYNEAGFLDGFFWTRILACAVALSLLLVPAWRAAILHGGRRSSKGAKLLVIGNKALGSIASIIIAYAVSIGSVTIINALSGLQFAFLFLFALLFANRMPRLADSAMAHGHGGWQTGIGVALIVSGLALIYLLNGNA